MKINSLPFCNKKLFCCIPVVVGWICAWHYHAMYQTMDDWDMRIILDGTAGGYISEPTEFSLYMNVLYGKFLKFFYTLYQGGHWYDVFTYLFCSVSVYVITLALCKNFADKSLFYKLLVLVVSSFICATAFVSPQFTITSGMLAISGVLAFFMFTTHYFSDVKSQIYCAVYCFVALLFSSLIRFEACMVVAFFMGVILLPLWDFRQWQEILRKSVLVVVALVAIVGAVFIDSYLVGLNPEWTEFRQFNAARVEITDKTNIWTNLDAPWKDIEDKLTQTDDYNFTKGDYRLLLTTIAFSKNNVFSAENLKNVAASIGDAVQELNPLGFYIDDYRNVFVSFVTLILLLLTLSYTMWRYVFFASLAFLGLVIALNYEFRSLPYRLWFNFAVITVLGVMIAISLRKTIKDSFVSWILFIAITCVSFNIMQNQALSTDQQFNVLKQYRSELRHLPKETLYLLNFANYEYIGRPFTRNIFRDSIVMSPLNGGQQYRKLFAKYAISEDEPWRDICSKESQVLILHNSNTYPQVIGALKKTIAYHMLEKYGKQVVFIAKEPSENLVTYQCRTLDDNELKAREQFVYQKKNVDASPLQLEWLKIDIAKRILGNDADYSDIIDLVNIISAEMIVEDEV